ncbi:uncharacterized protein LOC103992254 [Musa acuminata AAA Group]|uniref:uncharacterized protein LOC103992254 n=1 Tax=Musa acuminata AAA Group TaxID=214697 RepID=UPI0031E48CCB
MESRSLILAVLLTVLLSPHLVSADVPSFGPFPSPSSSPSPSPSPSPSSCPSPSPSSFPSPSPHTYATLQNHVTSTARQLPHQPSSNDGHQEQPPAPPGKFDRLNLGEKVGLAFLAVAVALHVVLGGFLVFQRQQLRKMERGDRLMAEEPSSSSASSSSS